MARQCMICGKKTMTGGSESRTGTRGYLKKRVKRVFKPNILHLTVETDKGPKRINICAKCLKSIKKKREEIQDSTS